MTSSSSSYLSSAKSHDGKLVAILAPSSASQQAQQQQRLRVQIYQTSSSNSTCSLQQTLTATTKSSSSSSSSSSSEKIKLVFVTTNVLIALVGSKELILWDLTRGVVADTITAAGSKSSSSKKEKEDDDETNIQFLDLAVPVDSTNASSSSSPEFFVLVSSNNSKLYTYEYQGTKLIRKIKSGKLVEGDQSDTTSSSSSSSSSRNCHLAVSASHILVHTPGSSSIRSMDRSSGAKTGKIKLFSHVKNSPSLSSSSLLVVSTLMICPNHSNTVLILGTATQQHPQQSMGVYNIETSQAYVEQFLAPSKNIQETTATTTSSHTNVAGAPVQILASDQDGFLLLIHQTMYHHNLSTTKSTSSSSSSHYNKLETISQLVTTKPGPLTMAFLSSTSTSHKMLVLQAPPAGKASGSGSGGGGGGGGECSSYWYTLDRSTLSDRIEIGAKKEEENDDDTKAKRKATTTTTTTTTTILGPGQAGAESRTVTVADPPAKKKIKTTSTTGEEGELHDNTDNDDTMMEDGVEDETLVSMSIAERLERLTKVMDEEDEDDDEDDDDEEVTEKQKADQEIAKAMKTKFQPKRATTESLAELLTQALQSNNDALLELALTVRDATVISKTLSDLEPSSLLVVLLGKLTTRLASSPLRAPELVTWLSPCLKQGHVRSSSINNNNMGGGTTDTTLFQTKQVAALRNLLHERMESFQDLVRLEGRLSMMCD